MKKRSLLICMLVLTFLSACSGGGADENAASPQSEISASEGKTENDPIVETEGAAETESWNGIIHCKTDLTHDGKVDDLYVNYLSLTYNSQGIATIDLVDGNGMFLWEGMLGLPHMAWSEYYLVTIDGEDYLLLYKPDESQDLYSNYYKLFYVNEDGMEIVKDEMNLSEVDGESIQSRLEEYYAKAAEYMEKGVLLISTWEGELKVNNFR